MGRAPFLSRLRRDERGVSALEFSFIAPVMILMFFGIAELGQGLFAQRRTEHAASCIGDLVAQVGNVADADMSNIFDAGTQVMAPLPASGLSMRVTVVVTDSNKTPKVSWSNATGTFAANTTNATYTMPTGMVTGAGQSFVIAETKYTYTSPIGYVLPNGLNFSDISYLSPRLGAVTRSSS